jgi:hypothetical protein
LRSWPGNQLPKQIEYLASEMAGDETEEPNAEEMDNEDVKSNGLASNDLFIPVEIIFTPYCRIESFAYPSNKPQELKPSTGRPIDDTGISSLIAGGLREAELREDTTGYRTLAECCR